MAYLDAIFLLIMALFSVRLWGLLRALNSDAPYVPIDRKVLTPMMRMVAARQPRPRQGMSGAAQPGEPWVDLGSGDGRVLIAACKAFPGIRGIGIERIAAFRWLSRFHLARAGLLKRVRIKRGNFFDHDLSQAAVISFYLSDQANRRLVEKFRHELRSGTILISHRFAIPDLPLIQEDLKHKIYIARVPERKV